MKKYFLLIASILVLLFGVSSMSYEQQTIVPTLRKWLENEPFYDLLSYIHVPYWGTTISVETRGYFYFIEFLVRKGLHFVGFGVISICFYTLYRKLKLKFAVLFAIGTTFLVASLDELRQSFVPGRTGIFQDVLLDTAGAITFVFVFKLFRAMNRKMKSIKFYSEKSSAKESSS